MMEQSYLIQQIKKLDRGKYEVIIEGKEALILYGKELSACSLKEHHRISEEQYQRVLDDILNKRATKRAMHLLERMERTEQALRDKLKEGRYPDSCIDYAIAYVQKYHYIDDFRYACTYVGYHQHEKGRLALRQKLLQKGVPHDIAERAIEECYESDELEQVCALLRKKGYCQESADIGEKRRMYAFLLRRGYASSIVSRAMNMQR